MEQEQTYGTLFIEHLRKRGRQTPFCYQDLQEIKVMSRENLADRLKTECREFSQFVLLNTPEAAAELVQRRRTEVASATAGASTVQCAGALMEILLQLFAAAH